TYSPNIAGTAAFYGDFEDLRTPIIPTQIADAQSFFPIGGAFFGTMLVEDGTPSPTPNNPTQSMRVVIDTGAQTCIMTPAMAANLSLPTAPGFVLEILERRG